MLNEVITRFRKLLLNENLPRDSYPMRVINQLSYALPAWFQTDACNDNENTIVSPRFVSMIPDGGLEVNNRVWYPNISIWASPEDT